MLTSLITFLITGLLFSGLAIPLIRRKIKINSWYGIRIPQTMENEKVWYEVNAIIGKYIFVFGIIISILSIYFLITPTNPEYVAIYILLIFLIIGSVFLFAISLRTASKISDNYYNQK